MTKLEISNLLTNAIRHLESHNPQAVGWKAKEPWYKADYADYSAAHILEACRELVMRTAIIFVVILAGCGGGMQAIEKLPTPPPSPAIVSGTYVFTLSGYPEGLGSQLPGPTLSMTFTQGQWQNGTAPLTGQGTVNGICWSGDPTQLNLQFTSTITDNKDGTESFLFDMDSARGRVLEMRSANFAKLTGTWTAGPGLDGSYCTLGGLDTSNLTWKAVKQ